MVVILWFRVVGCRAKVVSLLVWEFGCGRVKRMADGKICYVIVVDGDGVGDSTKDGDFRRSSGFWYTQSVLQSVLQLVGCKVPHALKISRRVFDILELGNPQAAVSYVEKGTSDKGFRDFEGTQILTSQNLEKGEKYLLKKTNSGAFNYYKKQVTVTVDRSRFVDCICRSLEKYRYVGPRQRDDIILACRLRERKESVTILLCGTSGCGKSTLSSLLASRLGITTVVSTDSIRHMMRSFITEKENPLLWASTYHAGEFLDPVAVAQAKARKKEQNSSSHGASQQSTEKSTITKRNDFSAENNFFEENSLNIQGIEVVSPEKRHSLCHPSVEQIGSKALAIEGYKAQSEMVIDRLDRLITTWEDRKESVVVEGVHLSLNFVMGLMRKHPSIIPFLVYIENEEKHLERFAIRAKYMTLDPSKNKYVKYIKNIRTIQDYLCKRAEKHLVPKVNNTNVDRSVASIHSTIFSCLRRREAGVSLYDQATNTVKIINEEYCRQCESNSIGSKRMFRMIQRQGSLRRYMAIVNQDGYVTKAWPFSDVEKSGQANTSNGQNITVGSPIYGPLKVHDAEPVNVQFGNFGIGSWPNNAEGTSNINNSHVEVDEETFTYTYSTSSPLHSNGHKKELIEEHAVSESEEEQFDDQENDSTDTAEEFDEEMEGSVVESSARSDEEYNDEKDERSSTSYKRPEGHKLSKHLPRTISMAPRTASEGRRYSRTNSLPLRRTHSSKTKSMTSLNEH